MMFFLMVSDFHNPPNQCSFRSNGRQGVVKYYENTNQKDSLPSYYHEKNKDDWTTLSGSFCPRESGNYRIVAEAKSNLASSFNYQPDYVKKGFGLSTYSKDYGILYLYANRCYPFVVSGNSGVDPKCKGLMNDQIIDSSNAVIMDCLTDDCLPGFYTDTCEKQNDAYCNNNGIPEYGRNSDGSGCFCDRFNDNIFCEDTSQYVFEEGKRGVQLTSKYNENLISTSQVYDDFDMIEMSESYSKVTIESTLFVPQNTDLQFLLQSTPKCKLFIDGNEINGSSLSDVYACVDDQESSYIESPRQLFNRGNHNIRIEMNPGCAIHDQIVSLRWKFYRLHRNPNPQEFEYESIPARYLGLPQ